MRNLFATPVFILLIGVAHAGDKTSEGCVLAGPAQAPVTIEEYADLECGYCAKGAKTMRKVLRDYPGQVKLIFRNMPLPFHSAALVAAKALTAVCLQDSALAYAFQAEVFHHQRRLEREGESYLYETADQLGVDVDQMKTDMAGPVVAQSISDDQQLAAAHGFKGTPSFMIGNESIVGAVPYSEIKAAIDRQLGH